MTHQQDPKLSHHPQTYRLVAEREREDEAEVEARDGWWRARREAALTILGYTSTEGMAACNPLLAAGAAGGRGHTALGYTPSGRDKAAGGQPAVTKPALWAGKEPA